ncbi:hypothetical protein, partial [Paenibacillus graminis]|uniref:hypothetical protein n=1 Tax=Paenibacillus graminis TaxID=189425 RepID=UPI0030EB1506
MSEVLKRGFTYNEKLLKLFEKLNSFRSSYNKVKHWLKPLQDAAHILSAPKPQTAECVRIQMHWLRTESKRTYTRKEDREMVE